MCIFFSYLGETYHLVKTYGSGEEERRQWHCHSHDDAHGAFVTLSPYTNTKEDEVRQLGSSPKPCRLGLGVRKGSP
jgi:hypothetical protein